VFVPKNKALGNDWHFMPKKSKQVKNKEFCCSGKSFPSTSKSWIFVSL